MALRTKPDLICFKLSSLTRLTMFAPHAWHGECFSMLFEFFFLKKKRTNAKKKQTTSPDGVTLNKIICQHAQENPSILRQIKERKSFWKTLNSL